MKRKYGRRPRRKTPVKRRRTTTSFKRNVKKALMQLTETKSVGLPYDVPLTLGTLQSEWYQFHNLMAPFTIPEGTGPNERIGARISLQRMRIPMYLCNQTPEPLLIKVVVFRIDKEGSNSPEFINPIGEGESFSPGHPWQADYPIGREYGTLVRQKKFVLNGSLDWGSQITGARPLQFTGNSGIKKLEMGFSFNNKKIFFQDGPHAPGNDINGIDNYQLFMWVWRLYGDRVPYNANHNAEGLGNLQIRQFHKLSFKDL